MLPSPLRRIAALLCLANLWASALIASCAHSPPQARGTSLALDTRSAERPLRLGVVQWLRKEAEQEEHIVPHVYSNHLPKSLVFETLVTCDRFGNLRPALAERWESTADQKTHTFYLRAGARFHDGAPCDAAAVVRYFRSWLVRDVDRFIGAVDRIASVEAAGPHTVVFRTTEPYAIVADLPQMNPFGVMGGAMSPGHPPEEMIGTGPWKVAEFESNRRTLYVRNDAYDGPKPLLERFEWHVIMAGSDCDPVSTWELERGRIDALVESWRPAIPRDIALEFEEAGVARIQREPGAMVRILCFNHGRAPFDDLAWRRVVQRAIDRREIVQAAEVGFARPCATLFAPEIALWPDDAQAIAESPAPAGRTAAQLLVNHANPAEVRGAFVLERQLARAGIDLDVVPVSPKRYIQRVDAGEYDLYFTRLWGAPYDPHGTLVARFCPKPEGTASPSASFYSDPDLTALVHSTFALPVGPERAPAYERIQALIDERAGVVPLYACDRIALLGPRVDGIQFGPHQYAMDFTRMRLLDAPVR